jgi:hypothetical protein
MDYIYNSNNYQDSKDTTEKSKSTNDIYSQKELDVNNYYILKYKSESNILKLIIFFCGLALIGCFFYLKGLIGETLYIIYLGFIIIIGILCVIYKIYDLTYRDNQKFDEYNYGYIQKPGTDIVIKPNKKSNIEEKEIIIKKDKKNKCV